MKAVIFAFLASVGTALADGSDVCSWCTDNNGVAVNIDTKKACEIAFGDIKGGPYFHANPEGTDPTLICGPIAKNEYQDMFINACNSIGRGSGGESCGIFSRIKKRVDYTYACCNPPNSGNIERNGTIGVCLELGGKLNVGGTKCEIRKDQLNQFIDACNLEYGDGGGNGSCDL
ncbi:hypothetical protein HII31_11199 [Pseudocercospora fuligena]|uniref:Cyanovirin-N domain-containing protein n=1 Tax=Pseudocercospora fuligena TaxID=685502 RepID=A0A8H6RAN7_9PEZI|nr:hypothetical protein HII31_11199 [Pseudocercospora fuligena]